MRNICLIVALTLCVLVVALARPTKEFYDVSKGPELFEKYQKDYNKVYKDEADKKVHYEAFLVSLAQINELNSKNSSATFGINHFADYTKEERQKMFGLKTE